MNRWDQIQAAARDVASNVHSDPARRDAMADSLIQLIGLMMGAIGKGVAIAGEVAMNDVPDESDFELDTESVDYTPEEVAEKEADFQREVQEEAALALGLLKAGELIAREAKNVVDRSVNVTGPTGPGVDLDRWSSRGAWKHVDRRPAMFRGMDERGALYVPPEVVPVRHCNCCAGPCRNGNPQPGPERCCYPLGDVCPNHC